MGDTNARTGTGQDYIDNGDKTISIPSGSLKSRFIRKRQSQDLQGSRLAKSRSM